MISVLIASASSKGSGESVHMHRLNRAFAACESVHMHRLARDFAAHEDEDLGQNVDF